MTIEISTLNPQMVLRVKQAAVVHCNHETLGQKKRKRRYRVEIMAKKKERKITEEREKSN